MLKIFYCCSCCMLYKAELLNYITGHKHASYGLSCLPCQAVLPARNEQPIKPSEPSGPWQYVEKDFQRPCLQGEYIFIMITRITRIYEYVSPPPPPPAIIDLPAPLQSMARDGIRNARHLRRRIQYQPCN